MELKAIDELVNDNYSGSQTQIKKIKRNPRKGTRCPRN